MQFLSRGVVVQITQITSFVYLSPMRTCRPLADWSSSIIMLTPVSCHSVAWQRGPRVSRMFAPRDKLHSPPAREIYASGGGFLVEPINAPHLFNPLIGTLKPQSNRPSYSNTVIGTLAVDGWAVTFGTARRGLGGAISSWVGEVTIQR